MKEKEMLKELKYKFRRYGIIFMIVLFTLVLGACELNMDDRQEEINKNDELEYYDIEYHRGGRDARSENTLYSYQYAIENGASTIECDMQLSADGQIVMSHNAVLNPDITVDSNGKRIEVDKYYIHEMTYEELLAFNVGSMDETSEYYDLHGRTQVQEKTSIPTLRQLFELVRDSGNEKIRLSIEAKYMSDPAGGALYEKNYDKDEMLTKFKSLVEEFGFKDRVQLQSFDWDILLRMEKLDSDIITVALYNEQKSWGGVDSTTLWLDKEEPSPWLGGIDIKDFENDPIKAAIYLGFDVISPYYEELSKSQVEEAHKNGMKVIPWTINSKEDMEKIYNMGVDGMITDKPWVLREFLESKGEKLPSPMKTSLPYHLEPDHLEVEEKEIEGGKDAAY